MRHARAEPERILMERKRSYSAQQLEKKEKAGERYPSSEKRNRCPDRKKTRPFEKSHRGGRTALFLAKKGVE